ncbi:hypothetical protein WN48_10693 [Eufriesea mexicana]|uniref:Uncharacterized protein n=1 Tax=Eufriesea mexicana TaxID=516756 RepID=A0A310SDN9_9HYME|nr:hypothetical protein WN48_10693 [Eufriesea mexicana]
MPSGITKCHITGRKRTGRKQIDASRPTRSPASRASRVIYGDEVDYPGPLNGAVEEQDYSSFLEGKGRDEVVDFLFGPEKVVSHRTEWSNLNGVYVQLCGALNFCNVDENSLMKGCLSLNLKMDDTCHDRIGSPFSPVSNARNFSKSKKTPEFSDRGLTNNIEATKKMKTDDTCHDRIGSPFSPVSNARNFPKSKMTQALSDKVLRIFGYTMLHFQQVIGTDAGVRVGETGEEKRVE